MDGQTRRHTHIHTHRQTGRKDGQTDYELTRTHPTRCLAARLPVAPVASHVIESLDSHIHMWTELQIHTHTHTHTQIDQ